MAIPVLIVGPLNELSAVIAAIRQRPDLDPIAFSTAKSTMTAAAGTPPTAVLLRPELPDASGFELARALRKLPATQEARLLMVLEETDSARRDAALEAGCDDVVYVPGDLATLGARVAGADEAEFRRLPRVPFQATVRFELPDGIREVQADSVSVLALRVRWNEKAPARRILPVSVEPSGFQCRTFWCKFEDLATRNGKPDGLLLRLLALTPQDRSDLQSLVDRTRGRSHAGPLETVAGPAKFEAPAAPPPADRTSVYQMLLPEATSETRARAKLVALAALVLVTLIAVVFGAGVVLDARNPSRHRTKNPVLVVEGLRVASMFSDGPTLAVVVDASWNDLDAAAKDRAMRALLDRALVKHQERVELHTARGPAARAAKNEQGEVTVELFP